MATLEHHGGADGVTGSCHRLRLAADRSLLIDCGLFQGRDLGSRDVLDFHRVRFPVDDLLGLVITHVHIDHIGRLPHLLAAGYNGPIYCSQPSAKLLPLVLEDALKIGFTRERDLIERFNTLVGDRLRPLPYNEWHSIVDDDRHRLRIRLQRAGHILGSAYVECDAESRCEDPRCEDPWWERARSRTEPLNSPLPKQTPFHQKEARTTPCRIVFSGDLGPPNTPLLPAPKPPQRADVLVLESTYGDRNHTGRADRRERLQAAIDRAHANGGTVIIPAFSIGRTQELLYELEGLIHRGRGTRWQGLEIIVDSPLAARFTRVYRALKPFWDEETHKRLRQGRHPLDFANLYTIDDHETHLKTVDYLATSGRPAVVIAASGMCVGGRVVEYLDRMLEDERHHVLFVGYQAEGTLGRAIQQAGQGGTVTVRGQRHTIAAGVDTISGYSAHADQHNLIDFVRRIPHRPREIRLVHGEIEARKALAAALQLLGIDNIIAT